MGNRIRRTARKGFTLVEILIVVVILGILAAIVVPQFANAADDARSGNLASQVKSVQNQIELFKARTGQYPTLVEMQAAPTAPGASGSAFGILVDNEYLKDSPRNPVNGLDTVAADTSAGWHYDAATGSFGASGYDEFLNTVDATEAGFTDIR